MIPTELKRSNQLSAIHPAMPTILPCRAGAEKLSGQIGNVGFGEQKRFARNFDDAFVRPAARGRREVSGRFRDVRSNHSEIPRIKFPNVWATAESERLRAVRVWVWAEPSLKHTQYVTTVKYDVKPIVS